MAGLNRRKALERIRRNIRRSGYHVYLVSGGACPRFGYTIGLTESVGFELVLAGAAFFDADDVYQILGGVHRSVSSRFVVAGAFEAEVAGGDFGNFTLRKAHASWTKELLLGALDYYSDREVIAVQIVPGPAHHTLDVPNLAAPWSAKKEPAWRWLDTPWPYRVPEGSEVITNLDALQGAPITEACRWEEDYWEMFAGPGPEVAKEDARVVPLGMLLGADPSLAPVVDLEIGGGLRRDDREGSWNPWVKRPN